MRQHAPKNKNGRSNAAPAWLIAIVAAGLCFPHLLATKQSLPRERPQAATSRYGTQVVTDDDSLKKAFNELFKDFSRDAKASVRMRIWVGPFTFVVNNVGPAQLAQLQASPLDERVYGPVCPIGSTSRMPMGGRFITPGAGFAPVTTTLIYQLLLMNGAVDMIKAIR